MRELTQQEIDNAPKWATHYRVTLGDLVPNCVSYYGDNQSQWMYLDNGKHWSPHMYQTPAPLDAKPIPRKEFDITKYQTLDEMYVYHATKSCVTVHDGGGDVTCISKQDSIALAKHFGHYKES